MRGFLRASDRPDVALLVHPQRTAADRLVPWRTLTPHLLIDLATLVPGSLP